MDPTVILTVLAKNGADVKAIVDVIGIDNLMKVAPHLLAILKTLQAGKAG